MKKLRNLTIKSLMGILFSTISISLILLCISVYFSGVKIKENAESVDKTYIVMLTAQDAVQQMINIETGFRGYLLTGEDSSLLPYNMGINSIAADFDKLTVVFSNNPTSEQMDRLSIIKDTYQKWMENVVNKGLGIYRDEGLLAASEFIKKEENQGHIDNVRLIFDEINLGEQDFLSNRSISLDDSLSNLFSVAILFITIGTLTSGIILFLIYKILINNVNDISIAISQLEDGVLLPLSIMSSKNEFFKIKQSFNMSMELLSNIVNELTFSSNNVNESSEELTIVMRNTLNNTKNELLQVEGISTAISELSSTSKEVSLNAVQAENETRKAIENVSEGHVALEQSIALSSAINISVRDTANLIEELKDRAVNIGEVTNVISSISDQINLLALNAAIEAARAGEHGRGFAVVADEVRNLAAKTQESTKNIQEIISALQDKSENANSNMIANVKSIQESMELSELVKKSFDDISSSVQAISDLNTLVATASQEQYSVTEDIAKNTSVTFDLVNENVAAVNQTQKAAQELAVLAEKQNQELSFFKQSNLP